MNRILLVFCILLSGIGAIKAQSISINDNGTAPDSSAMLDIKSTTQGLLIPRLTFAQRNLINNPATGVLIFQTDTDSGFYYNNGIPATPVWLKLITAGDISPWTTNGATTYLSSGTQLGIGTNSVTADFAQEIHATGGASDPGGIFINNEVSGNIDKLGIRIDLTNSGQGKKTGIITNVVGKIAQPDSLFGYIAQITPDNTTTSPESYAFKAKFIGTDGNTFGIYTENEDQNYFSGKVGIGTATPEAQLSINGSWTRSITTLDIGTDNTINNLTITDEGNVYRVIGPNSNATITGIEASYDGRMITFMNLTSHEIFFYHDDSRSVAANRLYQYNSGAWYSLKAFGSMSYIYSTADSRWVMFSYY